MLSAWNGRAVLYGKPEPKGSVRIITPPGKRFSVPINDNPEGERWAKSMAMVMLETAPEQLITRPLAMRITYYLPRPQSHYRTGKFAGVLRDDAPEWAPQKPDGEKLERNIYDAGTGVWYVDDKQIVAVTWRKLYVPAGERPRTIVECEEIR